MIIEIGDGAAKVCEVVVTSCVPMSFDGGVRMDPWAEGLKLGIGPVDM